MSLDAGAPDTAPLASIRGGETNEIYVTLRRCCCSVWCCRVCQTEIEFLLQKKTLFFYFLPSISVGRISWWNSQTTPRCTFCLSRWRFFSGEANFYYLRETRLKSIDIHGDFMYRRGSTLMHKAGEKEPKGSTEARKTIFGASAKKHCGKAKSRKRFLHKYLAWRRAKRCLNCEIKIYGSRMGVRRRRRLFVCFPPHSAHKIIKFQLFTIHKAVLGVAWDLLTGDWRRFTAISSSPTVKVHLRPTRPVHLN